MSANTTTQHPRFSREYARELLTRKIDSQRRLQADPKGFSTIDPAFLIADAEHRLRWIDCAPEGARHLTAPMMDKTGTPMGGAFYESVEGPSTKAYREAVLERTGRSWVELKIAQHEARLARVAA